MASNNDKSTSEKHAGQAPVRESQLTTWIQGFFIIALGMGFSYTGFRYGLKRSIERAANELDDKKLEKIDMNKVGPSGVPAKQMALKAFARGSVIATCIAAFSGFAMSYVVEAKHKGVSKEQEQREMTELYNMLGIDKDMESEKQGEESR